MGDRLVIFRDTHERLRVPAIWVATALSILVHIAVMWTRTPHLELRLPSPEALEPGATSGALAVYLAPPPAQRPSPAREAAPATALKAPPSKAAPRPRSPPPVLALDRPAPASPPPEASTSSVPAPALRPPPTESDLSAYIEAKRRARAESQPSAPAASPSNTPPVEDENARANRIIASNLAPQRQRSFGYDPTRSGGVFQIERMGYDSAEFIFYGWNRAIRRNTAQLIEVRKGGNGDIRIAVIRRMIAIIREYEQEDFLWESQRLGRNVTLSARARDNAGLEDFLMTEFFGDPRRPQ
jgi:outer membrane biosynthesis protein TonB